MNECVFCKIVKGEIPCVRIWEDKNHLAILDRNPNTEGMTLVIPKKHFDSYVFDMEDKNYKKLMLVAKQIARLLDEKLKIKRTALVCEGMGINHLHIKLYPMHGLKDKFQEMFGGNTKYFERYEGYITTELGPEKSIEELEKVARKIIN